VQSRRGDARAIGRPAAGVSEWKLTRQTVLARAGWKHDQTDAPYERGRLLVSSFGDGQFHFDVIRRNSKGEWPS